MIEAMRFGRIEIGYFGPFSYVLAKSKAPEHRAVRGRHREGLSRPTSRSSSRRPTAR